MNRPLSLVALLLAFGSAPLFGAIRGLAADPRNVQLALRFEF